MPAQTELKASLLERVGDGFTSFTEGVMGFVTRLLGGSSSERVTKSLGYHRPKGSDQHAVIPGSILARVNELEPQMQALSDDELKELTPKFRERLAPASRSTTCCRRRSPPAARPPAAPRTCGTSTCRSSAASSCTAATSPRWSPAKARRSSPRCRPTSTPWSGKGVHVITVNDYLARRDCEWMLPIYNALGITAGYIQSDMDPVERRHAYDCDITYGTNSEFGFDYLRDNMKTGPLGRPTVTIRTTTRCSEAAQLRHHRRGGQHPHRRGAHAAHHLRPGVHRRARYAEADEVARSLTELERKARELATAAS